jgi:dTDP-4-amino-4,6-dideoxygalactose transaminase
MTIKVPLTNVTLGEEEAQAAARVVRSGWVTMGAEVKAFEDEFAQAVGAHHAVAVGNGTAGLHLAYEAAGLGPDDEFIIPALTFVATLNAGLYLGGKPVLADCTSADDLTLSPQDVAAKITSRTRLIVTMAYGGHCPDMEAIMQTARRCGISIVEDACHAPLAKLGGRAIGTFGEAGMFSFFGNKNMTTGEGGMVVTNSDTLAARMRLMRTHGMTTTTWDRHRGHAADYDVEATGFNYRMDEIRAAIGREQLKKLPASTAARSHAAQVLRERLTALEIKGLGIPFAHERGEAAHHLLVILLPPGVERGDFRQGMLDRGIQTSVHYPPLHTFSHTRELWGELPPELPVLEQISSRLVTLPMGPGLDGDAIDLIATAMGELLQ